jgi:hypothetical protein
MNGKSMGKSLGDYNIEKSSSSNINNIKWTQKNQSDIESKNKKKTARKTSPSNIIYTDKIKKIKPYIEKVFKVEMVMDTKKSKNKKKKPDKKFQNSSADNCIIEQGFTRPGR